MDTMGGGCGPGQASRAETSQRSSYRRVPSMRTVTRVSTSPADRSPVVNMIVP